VEVIFGLVISIEKETLFSNTIILSFLTFFLWWKKSCRTNKVWRFTCGELASSVFNR